jgi:preprotein translocase subunit SecG
VRSDDLPDRAPRDGEHRADRGRAAAARQRADIGAVFGGGASSTVFGSRGAGNFLTKLTTGSALVFMVTSLSLAYPLELGRHARDLRGSAAPAATAPAPAGEAPAAPEAPNGGFEEVKPAEPAKPEASAPAEPAPTAQAPAPAGEKKP